MNWNQTKHTVMTNLITFKTMTILYVITLMCGVVFLLMKWLPRDQKVAVLGRVMGLGKLSV